MPTLDPPPLQKELPAVSFFGRTLDEYTRFFKIDPVALRGRVVLDVGAGPASFTAEASRRGINAVAVDPWYDRPADALALQVRQDYARIFAQMRAKPRRFRFKAFASFAAAEADRKAAAQRFLADYEGNARHGRYVRGALPLLPFLDGAFDLVLCAHLLFIHAACFDFDWHLEACVELARVSGGEVRIHPVCGADGAQGDSAGSRPYAGLERLRRELHGRGVPSEVVPVDYEFLSGSTSMLVLKREAGR